MDYKYSELVQQSKDWALQVEKNHWLETEQLAPLLTIEQASPQSLLSSTDERPLIVAFMGGTGVGKSTLLNRLAKQAIAKTGIERPTSYEVTLYHHYSLSLQSLPEKFPLDKIKTASHTDDTHKNIIWVDMPDFDSTELANKQLVLQWLPHIDVLIYVVSPDRYRDHKAWQLLLSEGQKHGWLFVFNQWDLGQIEQYEDFKNQLTEAGFNDPLIFRSSCTEQADDEFPPLLETITALATKNTISQLEQQSSHIKKQQLQQQLQHYLPLLGSEQDFIELRQHWKQQWLSTKNSLSDGFSWEMSQYASQYAEKEGQLSAKKNPLYLWGTWAQNRFDDVLDELILTADQLKLATIPLRKNLTPIRTRVGDTLDQQVELRCRQALINPGNILHRGLLKLSRFCEIVFPLLTMSGVGYQLFLGFYQSAQDKQDYLGIDFAVHSSLLIGISWLLPYFIHKKMQPSLQKAALRGLNQGLELATDHIGEAVDLTLEGMQQQQEQFIVELTLTIQQCGLNNEIPDKKGVLTRIIPK
ncbi:MAG: GTPase [Methylococcales bacterium]|nr:GTPase [Methylococcales bacterium]